MKRAHEPRSRRGFTLIELMVVLAAGLFFSIAVFMLTRDVTRFFERETRLSDATMASNLGFRRLTADVARAGFLASPNLAKDPRRCPEPALPGSDGTAVTAYASLPMLQKLGLLNITAYGDAGGTSADIDATRTDFFTKNGLAPDKIVLYGNYVSNEAFPVTLYASAAGGATTFSLEPLSGALYRAGYRGKTKAERQALLEQLFPAGRILRAFSQVGEEQYMIIGSVDAPATDTTPPTVVTKSGGPKLLSKSEASVCGTRGIKGDGLMLNTVNIIQYRLLDTQADPNFTLQFTGSRHPLDVATRVDLVREELDPTAATPTVLDGTREIVAENVVDLRFGLEVVSNKFMNTFAMTTVAPGAAAISTYASDPTSTSKAQNAGPHLIRGVRVRLSTRSASPDRDANVLGPDVGAGLYRVALDWTGGTLSEFARVRTLESTVATRNTRYVLW